MSEWELSAVVEVLLNDFFFTILSTLIWVKHWVVLICIIRLITQRRHYLTMIYCEYNFLSFTVRMNNLVFILFVLNITFLRFEKSRIISSNVHLPYFIDQLFYVATNSIIYPQSNAFEILFVCAFGTNWVDVIVIECIVWEFVMYLWLVLHETKK